MDFSKLWRISVYLAITLHCLSSSAAQGVNQCSLRCWNPVQHNSNVFDGLEQAGVTNEGDCKALCVNNGTCIGVDWNTEKNECWFQMEQATINNQSNINHWSLANCTDDCVSYCWRPVKIGVQVTGGVQQSDITDENHCKLRCSNTSTCTGIDWASQCWLISTKNPPNTNAGIHHWDIERNLSASCLRTTITTERPTTTATTTATTTTTTTTPKTTTVTTTPPLEITTSKPTTTETLISVSSTSSAISSGTPSSTFTNTSDSSSSDPSSNNNTKAIIIGVVVGGFFGLILIIALLVLIILLVRKRQRNEKLREIGDDILMETDDNKKRIRPVIPPKPKLTSMPMPSTDPVSLTKLSSHFAGLNSGDGFKQEFDSLPLANYESCSAAKGSDNAKKNRFKNILPYDATRVKVQNNGASNYINANYIEGYDGAEKVYIAAQGPLKTTLNDFWQMIWNDALNRIVMITELMEQGKSKCDKYWPDGINCSKDFHKVIVTLVECHVCTDYTKRVMRVEHKEYDETRLVTQLHFRIWNDKGVPTEVYPLLAFRKRVRLLDEEAAGPMLVHCSAGAGRTGTFIALDCLLEQAEKTKQVSVFGVVKKLREQRMIMVQVADQYKLLYQAVLEANKAGVTDIDKSSFKQLFSTSNVNQNFPESLETSSEFEFNLLEDVKRLIAVNEKSAGHQRDNLDKNRSRDTIPDDKVRIYLSPASHQSDYINAVLTQGHRSPGHYILTQLPLKETISDFWRMVAEHNCPTIVVLEPPDETDESTCSDVARRKSKRRQLREISRCSRGLELAYWPSEARSTLQFGKISIKLSSKVTAGEILGLELQLKRSGSPPQIVHLYQLSSWSRDAEFPDSDTDVLDLIGMMSDRHQQLMNPSDDAAAHKDRNPAIIVCLDGAKKSGLFVAASYLIDKMNSDRLVDAYLSSRYVISSRPQAITSLAQYRYIFQLAAEHLRWTPTVTMDFAAAKVAEDIYVNANQSSSNGVNQPIYANG